MRRLPTADDRTMERAHISIGDMRQAVDFIDAALAAEKRGANSKTDVTHLALVVSAVIYYARPFGPNEGGKKRKERAPPKGAPPMSRVDIGPLAKVLSSKEGRRLHRDVLRIRNKIVAHAESRYFPVRMVAAFAFPKSGRVGDFALQFGQRYPLLNLNLLRSNAMQLAAAFGLYGHFAAVEVRRTRKRLRKK
jgi:hypothetical protein